MSSDEPELQQHFRSRWNLVVGIAVVLFLAALLFPAIQSARESARRTCCLCDLKNLGLAMWSYKESHGRFPPASYIGVPGDPSHSWRVLLLPGINEDELYRQYHFTEPWDGSSNREIAAKLRIGVSGSFPVYHCASDFQGGPLDTSYVMIVGKGMVSTGADSASAEQINDGLSQTILVAEMSASGIPWMAPCDLPFDQMSFSINALTSPCIRSAHPGTANVMTCDGAVFSLPETTDPELIKALLTIAGGEDTGEAFACIQSKQ